MDQLESFLSLKFIWTQKQIESNKNINKNW